MSTVAQCIVSSLAHHGVTQVWGVVGDALNPVTDAIRTTDGIDWIGVRHEEAAAYAAGAQAQLTGRVGVCMGTVGPGAIHLLNGLYDAKKSHAPVLAVVGQVPTPEVGTDYFQEVDNDKLFADVAVWAHTLTSADQLPHALEAGVNAAYELGGVAVLTLPGDVGSLEMDDAVAIFSRPAPMAAPGPADVWSVADAIAESDKVTLLVGRGAAHARSQVVALATALQAPMVVTVKGKPAFDGDNPFNVGQAGLLGNPAAASALKDADLLLMVGTDFPYREYYPDDALVVQIDSRASHLGRRTRVDIPLVGDAAATLDALLPLVAQRDDTSHLDSAVGELRSWRERQAALADPGHDDEGLIRKARSLFDNPEGRIRPEAVATAVDRAAPLDAVFTVDTGMSTVWLARFVEMRGDRELLGSFNLGSMANALPQALGAAAADRTRRVISFSGDGGLMMLLGDLRTAVTYSLPIVVVVFDNARLGMVKLEQEEGGLPEFGTRLDNPDLAAVASAMGLASRRVEDPDDVDEAVRWALAQEGPVLLDMVTNPDEVAVPPHPSVSQAWGFAVAKVQEALESRA
ncbi:thiamine pyrophosphate-dependent enzyme [Demequina capsici]|uniref:Thiamine pyrophosphate-binding protein n=1 Tax=Demequina capsici TaxID=3075620 RepID=A0AA96F7G0_9MICO|nr:thiamine pyrophosphate-dependent enzyme [Demequina sp. OYTSA14]WNM24145.1 thiamine pyrophosphate-binding protein [Demequina sp. OYTSA14]